MSLSSLPSSSFCRETARPNFREKVRIFDRSKGARPIAISDIVYQFGLQQRRPFDFGSKKACVCPKKCVRSVMALFLTEPLKMAGRCNFSVFNSADLARAKSQFPTLFISVGCKNLPPHMNSTDDDNNNSDSSSSSSSNNKTNTSFRISAQTQVATQSPVRLSIAKIHKRHPVDAPIFYGSPIYLYFDFGRCDVVNQYHPAKTWENVLRGGNTGESINPTDQFLRVYWNLSRLGQTTGAPAFIVDAFRRRIRFLDARESKYPQIPFYLSNDDDLNLCFVQGPDVAPALEHLWTHFYQTMSEQAPSNDQN